MISFSVAEGELGEGCGKLSGQPGNVIFVLVPCDWRKLSSFGSEVSAV